MIYNVICYCRLYSSIYRTITSIYVYAMVSFTHSETVGQGAAGVSGQIFVPRLLTRNLFELADLVPVYFLLLVWLRATDCLERLVSELIALNPILILMQSRRN